MFCHQIWNTLPLQRPRTGLGPTRVCICKYRYKCKYSLLVLVFDRISYCVFVFEHFTWHIFANVFFKYSFSRHVFDRFILTGILPINRLISAKLYNKHIGPTLPIPMYLCVCSCTCLWMGAFLRWWPPSTMWVGSSTFYGYHRGCLNNPIFSNLGLCAACWAHNHVSKWIVADDTLYMLNMQHITPNSINHKYIWFSLS